MALVAPFFEVTSPFQLPGGIDPKSLVNLDLSDPADPSNLQAHASGIHIGSGVILTAAHVAYDIADALNGPVWSGVTFDINFGSGLSSIPDVALHIDPDDPEQRLVDGRDRFDTFARPTTGSDVALIDLSQGGPVDAGDATFLASVQRTPMVVFSNPDDAIGLDIMLLGYPAETRDGSTLCRADGEITGHGPVALTSSGETLLEFSALVNMEGGFSGGPVYVAQAIAGVSTTVPLLLGLASASFGAEDGLFAPMSAIYAGLAKSLSGFHSADDFARNVLIGDRTSGGTVQGRFFHEDIFGGAFSDKILAGDGNDSAKGEQGRDRIFGGLGNDTLFGGANKDRISDGQGQDAVLAGGGNDVISSADSGEADFLDGGAGEDTVSCSGLVDALTIDLSLQLITGTSGQGDVLRRIEHAEGGQAGDVLLGNGRANVLDGGLGNDTLTGRGGNDSFVFSTALDGAANVDTVSNFQHLGDRIILTAPEFGILGPTIDDGELRLGSQAADANDHLIYDSATGQLYLDLDGAGGQAQVQFAVVTPGTVLTLADLALA